MWEISTHVKVDKKNVIRMEWKRKFFLFKHEGLTYLTSSFSLTLKESRRRRDKRRILIKLYSLPPLSSKIPPLLYVVESRSLGPYHKRLVAEIIEIFPRYFFLKFQLLMKIKLKRVGSSIKLDFQWFCIIIVNIEN